MKRIIAAVSAAAAALVLMAALAAPAGADTVVCQFPETPCPSNSVEAAGSQVQTGNVENSKAFVIDTGGWTEFRCSTDIMAAKSKASHGNPLPAEYTGTLGGCEKASTKLACTGSMNAPATNLEASTTGGYMKIGTAAEPLTVTFKCGSGAGEYVCSYTAQETIKLNAQETEAKTQSAPMYRSAGAGYCDATSPHLSVKNLVSEGYISKYTVTGTVLCKTAAEPCGEANRYGPGTTLSVEPKAGTKVTFGTPQGATECESSPLSGQLIESSGQPFTITSASFSNCSNGMVVTAQGLPWTGVITDSAGAGDDTYQITNAQVKVSFYGLFSCVFKGSAAGGQVKGNSEVVFNAVPLEKVSGSPLCGSNGEKLGTMSGTYLFSSPSPLFISWM